MSFSGSYQFSADQEEESMCISNVSKFSPEILACFPSNDSGKETHATVRPLRAEFWALACNPKPA